MRPWARARPRRLRLRLLPWRRLRGGAAPGVLPLLLTLASFAVTLYAGTRLLEGDTAGVVLWFLGAALLHDLVLLPVCVLADRGLQLLTGGRPGREGGPATEHAEGVRAVRRAGAPSGALPRVNYLRVPAFVSGVLLLVWFPLVLGRVESYGRYTTLSPDVFWGRWLWVTAVLFAVSACCLAVAERRHRRPRGVEQRSPQAPDG